MAEVTKVAKEELRALLEALGHTFYRNAYVQVSSRPCFRTECKACGQEWVLRFSPNPGRTGHAKLVADFPKLGERCAKQQKLAAGG